MFNFNNAFDFNSVLESKRNIDALSLDDFEDEFNSIPEEPSSKQRVDMDLVDVDVEFRMFLKANIFKPLEVDVDSLSANAVSGNRFAWKTYVENGEKHYLAYINLIQERNSKRYDHDIYVDLNGTTRELHIGNCTTYKATKFLNISYPLIKICEQYKDGPVYIGCIHIDKPYAAKGTTTAILDSIKTPMEYIGITENMTFWRTVWNNKGYYLPDVRPGMKLMDIEKNLKLSSNFVEHFKGFDSKLRIGTKISLFYNMFNSFEDFAKITKILCDANALVFIEFGIELTKSTYNENIQLFQNKLSEQLGIEFKRKQNLAEVEEIAQKVLVELLPQNVIDHFESINSKAPNLLSIRTMSKERKSKDPYRKLDLPVIKLILKDNGIDIDEIVNDYEQQWLANFYNFTNMFYKHLQKLNVASTPNQYDRYSEYELIVDNLFTYNRLTLKFEDANGEKQDFDGLTDREISIIKAMAFGLKPELKWEDRQLVIDKQRLDNPDDEACIALCRLLLSALGRYSSSVMSDSINENNHVYNEFIMIQRFIYLLYKLYSEDFNKNVDEDNDKLPAPDPTTLFNMRYSYVSFGHYGDYYPFNFGDIGMKLNTYNQLYKFIKYIAYIIENGYDIHCPNIGGACGSMEGFLTLYDVNENLNDLVEKEFSLSNVPNLNLLNMNSINKMLSTIFTNIDKKI